MKVPESIVYAIYEQAIAEAPLEACGYLAGNDGVVTRCYPMANADQSETHFSFDPQEQFRVFKKARAKGLELIAVYHSHPETPARPSAEDIRLAYDPAIYYVIASLADGQKIIKSFKIIEGKVIAEPLEIC